MPRTPEEAQALKKQRGANLFMTQMFIPKIPVIWAKFHSNPDRDASKATQSSGITIPFVEGETMNRTEFHDFVEAFLRAQAEADGHGIVRMIELVQFELQLLVMFNMKEAAMSPSVPIALPFQLFKNALAMLVFRIVLSRYEITPYIMRHLGLEAMRLPKLPQMPWEEDNARTSAYCREAIMPALITFIRESADRNQNDPNLAKSCGFLDTIDAIITGIDAYMRHLKQDVIQPPNDHRAFQQYIRENDKAMAPVKNVEIEGPNLRAQALKNPQVVLQDIKVMPKDEHISIPLLAFNATNLVVRPLLTANPVCLTYIAKEWHIDLVIKDKDGNALQPPPNRADGTKTSSANLHAPLTASFDKSTTPKQN